MENLKRPKEFEELPSDVMYLTNTLDSNTHSGYKQCMLIAKAKKDAWNAAIKWAAENANCTYDSCESHVSGEYCFDVNVDKQSILNGLIDD